MADSENRAAIADAMLLVAQNTNFEQAFHDLFGTINDYQTALGSPSAADLMDLPMSVWSTWKADHMRNYILAMHAELSELLEAYPWKPWRPTDYKEIDIDNVLEEVVDILFFLNYALRITGLSRGALAERFKRKLKENYERILSGYNRSAEDMKK